MAKFWYWLKQRPRYIKWWFQRANGNLPECDIWDYWSTLAPQIEAAMDYFLRPESVVDWEADGMVEDLRTIQRWAKKCRYYEIEHTIIIVDDDEPETDDGEWAIYKHRDWYEQYQTETQQAFMLLGKHFRRLWE